MSPTRILAALALVAVVTITAASSAAVTVRLFAPDAPITRCEYVTVEWRQAGSPDPSPDVEPWPDVSPESFCYDASRWAREHGYFVGVPTDLVGVGIALHFADQPDKARRVGTCESGLDNAIVGARGEVSWIQIHPGWWNGWGGTRPSLVESMGYTRADLVADPVIAAEVARAIYDRTGDWPAWACGNA